MTYVNWQAAAVVVVVTMVVMVVMVVQGEAGQQYCTHQPDASNPPVQPEVALQYTTKAEATREMLGEEHQALSLVTYKEWTYDGIGNKIALKMFSKYGTNNYIMDWNTKQMTSLHIEKEGLEYGYCYSRPLDGALDLFPVLIGTGQNVSSDHMPDPGVPLGILNWTDTHYKGIFNRRDIPSHRWEWCGLTEFEEEEGTDMVSMATYWSVPDWKMPIPTSQQRLSLPLGWEVLVWGSNVTAYDSPLINSFMYYEPGIKDYSVFLIPEGIHCPELVSEPGHPFPDLSQYTFFSFSLEYRETGNKSFTWADAWYDFGMKLYRIDHDTTPPPTINACIATRATATTTVTTTLLLDYNDGVAFEFVPGTLYECQVSLVNETQEDWADLTGLHHLWGDSPSSFFGSDVINYTYYGTREERYMHAGDWRGTRSYFPLREEKQMLWQWTFTSKNVSTLTDLGDHVYVEGQVPIGVRINTLDSTKGRLGSPLKDSVSYSIYDFEVDEVGKSVDFNGVRVFDAYACYSANWRDHLRFKLDLTSWPGVVDTPLLTSVFLNEYWHATLALYGQVSPIRITRVQTIIEEAAEVWVEFVLLYRHYRIGELDPDLFESMTTGTQARSYLSAAVNNGDIKYEGQKPGGEGFTILALHGSLTAVVEQECTTTATTTTTTTTSSTTASTTTSTTTTTTTTSPGHTTTTTTSPGHTTPSRPLSTASSTTTVASITTTGDTPSADDQAMYTPGDLAGLGVGMLMMGLALGAGGTFLVVVKGLHHIMMGWCKKS